MASTVALYHCRFGQVECAAVKLLKVECPLIHCLEELEDRIARVKRRFFPWTGLLNYSDTPFSESLEPEHILEAFAGRFQDEPCVAFLASNKFGNFQIAFCPELENLVVVFRVEKDKNSTYYDKRLQDFNMSAHVHSMHVTAFRNNGSQLECQTRDEVTRKDGGERSVYLTSWDYREVTTAISDRDLVPKVTIENGMTVMHPENRQIR